MAISENEAETTIRAAIRALQEGRAGDAQSLFEQVVGPDAPLTRPWFLLAQACNHAGDYARAEEAVDEALRDQPRNIGALILKGDCRRRSGDRRAAVTFYSAAVRAAPFAEPISPLLAAELRRADAMIEEASGSFEQQLEHHLRDSGVDPATQSPRFRDSLDILSGRKEVYLQQPSSFYFPALPQVQFYERADFPWLEGIEAAAPAMRAELEAVLAGADGFEPYVRQQPGRPQPANHLLEDPSWSACWLLRNGEATAQAARCPITLAALETAPMPYIAGRSPIALFSLLRPGTHIKPHHGLLNTRLICHIPLIAPPGCRLRVGNETRLWEQGRALVFDDSIEHEAWNDGSETRVVLLFEIWRPEISNDERRALTVMYEAITAYEGAPVDY